MRCHPCHDDRYGMRPSAGAIACERPRPHARTEQTPSPIAPLRPRFSRLTVSARTGSLIPGRPLRLTCARLLSPATRPRATPFCRGSTGVLVLALALPLPPLPAALALMAMARARSPGPRPRPRRSPRNCHRPPFPGTAFGPRRRTASRPRRVPPFDAVSISPRRASQTIGDRPVA